MLQKEEQCSANIPTTCSCLAYNSTTTLNSDPLKHSLLPSAATSTPCPENTKTASDCADLFIDSPVVYYPRMGLEGERVYKARSLPAARPRRGGRSSEGVVWNGGGLGVHDRIDRRKGDGQRAGGASEAQAQASPSPLSPPVEDERRTTESV